MQACCRQAVRAPLAPLSLPLLVQLSPPSLATELATKVDTSAPGLVRAALDAEVRGDVAARAKLLNDAIAADPDFAPARWQAGFVQQNKEWLTLQQAAERSS